MTTRQFANQSGFASPRRERLVKDAARQWTDQLMDVSGRNQLLFYRDLKVGTLDLEDAERTAHRFRPAPPWLGEGMAVWSGDTVIEDAEGLLRFVGRDDEMIKVAGNRVSPQEVEEAILSGGEALEAVAVGVHDDRLGQAIVAMVAGDAAREAALRTRLRAELHSFLQPQHYRWFAELPRNANGKLDRAALRRLATE